MDQPGEGPAGGPVDGVDARTDRVAQGVVGVALLAAFVFRVFWVVPGVALVVAVGALAGTQANGLHVVFNRWIGPRLSSRIATSTEGAVPAATVRGQDGLAAIVLTIASFAFVLGISPVGWLLALAVALMAIVAATTRVHLADRLRRAR